MKRFSFTAFPEQFFHFKNDSDDFIPVIPVFEDISDFNRIISALKRWDRDYAVFFDRKSYPLKQFLVHSNDFPNIFVEDAEVAVALRDTGFAGGLYLFSNFRQLAYPEFFKEYSLTPVVTGKINYEKISKAGLSPVYVISDKTCVADLGLCISRKGQPQCFYNCDNRCRERSKTKSGLNFPVSMKPENKCPSDSSVLLYTEKTFHFPLKEGEFRDQMLENCWNYRYPIGKEILKSGTGGQGRSFIFAMDKNTEDLYEKGLLGFYGYKGTLYKGNWITPLNNPKVKKGRISISVEEGFSELLMVVRYSEEEKDFLKKARHFIFTLPEKEILDAPVIDNYQTVPVKKGHGRFSNRAKLTIISEDPGRFSTFKGRHVERKVLVFKRGVTKKHFNGHILLDGDIDDKDIEEISNLSKIRGIVVKDSILKIYLERLFPEKEILLHPLNYTISENAPSFLSASTTIFVSGFRSDKKRNYSWKDMNIYLKHRRGCLEFISRKQLFRGGKRKELWVDVAETTDDALKFLKTRAENYIRTSG